MKGKFIYQLVVCISFFLSAPLLAQNNLYNVQQWELEDGLLHRLVHVVHEDEQGFIWIGTENGIQRFDGHEFKSYASADPQKSTLRITKIGEDDGNWLWDKSRDEFSFLNTKSEKMESEEEHFGAGFPIHSARLKNTCKIVVIAL